MIHTFISNKELAEIVTPLIKGKKIVALDGFEGVGKSKWFSRILSEAGGLPVTHLDHYVKKQQGSHSFYILKSRKSLRDAIRSYTNGVVVEGLFVKKILDRLGISPDLWIYIKKMAVFGWSERNWLDKEHARGHPQDLNFYLQVPRNRQHYSYHMKYMPQVEADLTIEVNEELYN